jgi:hypothetical protein
MRQFRSLRRARPLLPGETAPVAEPAGWPPGDERAAATGNFFHRSREKTRRGAPRDPRRDPRRVTLPGRLNLFQATMLDWRDQHPYNAVHAVALAAPLDAHALARAIDAELAHCGLTHFEVDRARGRYAWHGGAAETALEIVEPGDDWEASLARAFERHLNAPFARDGRIDPFRFFAMPVAGGCVLGLAYDHFVAGGDSIIVLLNAIADRYAGDAGPDAPPRLYPRTHAHLFVRHPLRFARGLARLPSLAASCRRTIRPCYRAVDDGRNGFTFFMLDARRYTTLRRVAKGWGVTLNDALMALLLLAQASIRPPRDMRKRRRELAVGSIVNLRNEHREDPRATFGQFLSSLRVSHPVPDGITLEELARDVHRATARIKREKLYLTTLFAMAVDRAFARFQSPRQRMGIYAKNYPVGAGVSSLNVNALWRGSEPAPLYVRGVPTGPLSPIVVAVTTSGDTLCAGVSYRTAAVSADDVARIRDDVLARIDALQ